ncbi:MAG: isoprenylcysteine carboxylmethyltransferase family protein [Candidatus Marinimicrobia bacterium]|nr:isoprenylcysteine carboxylmethyltransferase family protein [Candidatus Neomarinimicrobiota bacterium]
MEIIGKTSIHPVLFYSGKFAGYATWGALAVSLFTLPKETRLEPLSWISFILLGLGLLVIVTSLINLGKSTRLGLPQGPTRLKTNGLYKRSRNPMYLGFNLLTLSAILHLHTPLILVSGVYSIMIYHFIILAEEKFMERCFKDDYIRYKETVRRYI